MSKRIPLPHPARILTILTIIATAMIVFRVAIWGQNYYYYFIINLALAWIPYAISSFLYEVFLGRITKHTSPFMRRFTKHSLPLLNIPLFTLWLMFYPNAPYLLTDIIHLTEKITAPLWYDVLMIELFVVIGMTIAVVSLHQILSIVRNIYGKTMTDVTKVVIIFLSSFGIALGRFIRFNSWDFATQPSRVLESIFSIVTKPFSYPQLTAVTIVFAVSLWGIYEITMRQDEK